MRKKLPSLTGGKASVAYADTSGAVLQPSGPHHRIRWFSSNGMHDPLPWNPQPDRIRPSRSTGDDEKTKRFFCLFVVMNGIGVVPVS
ncbi:hypothetical protein DFAR_730001 [Desulfarculales bacterium]